MKLQIQLALLALCLCLLPFHSLRGEEADTLITRSVDLDELVVIAPPKENKALRELPTASTQFGQQEMRSKQIHSVKNLTSLVPNLFIPDYGSKLTTAVYIRGIGSRINTPAVGLYVDNIPYIDKSAFDFNYADIEQIEVLRGPQSMLYGRNTMGGLIKVHTKSPFTYQGTDIRLGAATYGDYNASLTHYHRISPRFAFSAGGFYEHNGGFFKNSFKGGRRMDYGQAGGGRVHGMILPTSRLKVDLNLSYEYSDQGGYPYFYTGSASAEGTASNGQEAYLGKIAYNDDSGYLRHLLNAGLNIEYQHPGFTLNGITGFQYLKDHMAMDQDFSPRDIFTLEQWQRSKTLSEEIVLKAKPGRRWQWTSGVFGFYQWLHTAAPVHFKRQGIEEIIEDNANNAFPTSPQAPQMHLDIYNDDLLIDGNFSTPLASVALYHQSTWNDLLVKGLSVTVGLRLDYEKMWLDYRSASAPMRFGFSFQMPSMGMELHDDNLQALSSFAGDMKRSYLQLLPKFAIQYEWKAGNNVYATVAKGYRSGGYNIQMFSDLVQSQMRNTMKEALMGSEVFQSMAGMIDKMMPETEIDVKATTVYQPEYSWNYEVGAHLNLWQGRLTADLAGFVMDTRNQQVSQFSENGMGRVVRNAGKSRSLGGEASLAARLTDALTLNVGYGYTHATFRDYHTIGKQDEEVDYSGHSVPFIPRQTLNAGIQYLFRLRSTPLLDRIRLNADYNAAGRIYWTEDNTVSQPFYGTVNGSVTLEKGQGSIGIWVRNALNARYASFCFESMGSRFEQRGKPLQAGIELRCRF